MVGTLREFVAIAPDQSVARFVRYSNDHYEALKAAVSQYATVVVRRDEKTENNKFVYSYRKLRQVNVILYKKILCISVYSMDRTRPEIVSTNVICVFFNCVNLYFFIRCMVFLVVIFQVSVKIV